MPSSARVRCRRPRCNCATTGAAASSPVRSGCCRATAAPRGACSHRRTASTWSPGRRCTCSGSARRCRTCRPATTAPSHGCEPASHRRWARRRAWSARRARCAVSATAVAPAFTRQPASTVALSGGAVTLLAAVSGTPVPTLQWQRWQAGGDWTDIAGEHDAQLNLASVEPGDDGARFRVASNGGGTSTSAVAALSVVDQASAPVVGPVSGDLDVTLGGTAVFAATVSGTAPLSYQWTARRRRSPAPTAPILHAGQRVRAARRRVRTCSTSPTAPAAPPPIAGPPAP